MGRQSKKCQKNCPKHLFILKPVHYSAFISRQCDLRYCPANLRSEPSFPKFNKDRKPYTASFYLACDKSKLIKNDAIYCMQHERFKRQHCEQKDQIYNPKPKMKNLYCNVCKSQIEDYQQHISSSFHKKIIKENLFNQDLLAFCQKFGNNIVNQTKIGLSELLSSFVSKYSSQTLVCQQNQKDKFLMFNEEEHLSLQAQQFPQQSVNETINKRNQANFQCFEQHMSEKYENNFENVAQNNFFQNQIFRELNENFLMNNLGTLKNIEQTSSPVKTKFQKPIILTRTILKLDQ